MFWNIYITSLVITMGLLLFYAIRNSIVYNARCKAIDYIYARKNWQQERQVLDTVSYERMMWQISKWTFKQFYPQFNEEK